MWVVTLMAMGLCCVLNSASLKILGVVPTLAQSHYYPLNAIVKSLANRGHEITLISFDKRAIPHPNIEDIVMPKEKAFTFINSDFNQMLFKLSDLPPEEISVWDTYPVLVYNFGKLSCACMQLPVFQEFLHSNRTYDLLIIESFSTDCYLGLVDKFKVPFIQYSSMSFFSMHFDRFGQPENPAYIPGLCSLNGEKMNFLERVQNTVLHLKNKYDFNYRMVPGDNELAKKTFGNDLRHIEEIAMEASLFLINTHFSYSGARPNVPGVIEIGGVHIEDPIALPRNIEKWINESKDGVIYFSMGSMIKGHTFPEEKRKVFLRAFGRLKQRVLWKWENETMPDKPDNVMIQKWMPQFDILSHPNVKAFISHGGLLGTTEAVHCGVPVVVMPQFGDQHTNARALEAGGGGVVLNFREADEEMVYNALKKVLDPEFNKKAKELSARFRDRPMSPMDTAIYWIEYVARHKGAHHLRTAAVGMPLYQYLLLDVFGFLALCVLSALFVAIFIAKMLLRFVKLLFSSGDKKQKKQKKQ